MGVSIEMDLDLRVVERTIFTVLDLLSGIGGLSSILAVSANTVIVMWHWHGLPDYFLISHLFNL